MAYHHKARGKDKDSAKLRRMAYNNKNFLKRREAAVRLANQHYEPGRQDRSYRWVWERHIRPLYHVSYNTFMAWVRAERNKISDITQQSLF